MPEGAGICNTATGEVGPIRCRATNLCRYCARLYAIETSEMFLLDAMEYAPTIYVVLTAREHLTRAQCRDHLQQLRRAARKRWPRIEWAVLVEFQRRGALHLNLLVKGVGVDLVDELASVLSERWCSRVDALPQAQYAGEIGDGIGVVKYVTQHFMKQAQAPAIGWRGHRSSQTRGYLVRPASVMREEARASLRVKRLVRRGVSLEEALREVATPATWRAVGMPRGVDLDRKRHHEARAPFGDLVRS